MSLREFADHLGVSDRMVPFQSSPGAMAGRDGNRTDISGQAGVQTGPGRARVQGTGCSGSPFPDDMFPL